MALSQKELKIDREPLGEAFPDSVGFHEDLEPIILGYLNGDIDDAKSTPEEREKITFFRRNIQTLQVPYLAALAAEKMLWCDADGVEALVKKNPSILKYIIPEVKDPCGRILKNKTLLQIAGAMNEFDPWEMKPEEKPYGIVPRLARYLPKEEAASQLSAQFPSGWEEETNARMKKYYTALTTFGKSLINTPVSPPDSTFEAECKPIIETYISSLHAAANKEVTIGLIFSPQIFLRAMEYFTRNYVDLNNYYSKKANVFWNIGYGGLQQRASGDAPIIKHGIEKVVVERETPTRSLEFEKGTSYYHCGVDSLTLSAWGFFFNDQGWDVGLMRVWADPVQKLMSNKNNSMQKFMPQPDNQSKNVGEFRNRP